MKAIAALAAVMLVHLQPSAPLEREVMARLHAALAPAIATFPETDDTGAAPVRGNTEALWMVRPPQDGERAIEILANPLNEANQLKANRAMAAIERNIEAAQRRATAQYEAAVAEAKRTGRSQEVDGVTLADEGIDGARIDAESHVTIDVAFNESAYRFVIAAGATPAVSPGLAGSVGTIVSLSGAYRDDTAERFAEAETLVFLGRVSMPKVTRSDDHSYEVTATALPADRAGVNSLVVRYRGNEALIKELTAKTAWNSLLELLK
jgi:hypothetical protein